MRLLHFADLHLDTPFQWAEREQAGRRRQALRQTLTKICEVAQRTEVDALLCGGDLYEHDRFSPDTAEFLRSTFAAMSPIPVFIAPGNHDWFGPESLYRQVEWSSNVHVFDTAELTSVELDDGLLLWGAAHCAPANTANFLETFRVRGSAIHVGLFHGSAESSFILQESGKRPHASFRPEQIGEAGFDHVFLGHFHHPVDATDHTYPGNPDPLTFGETWRGAAVLATVTDKGVATRERIDVSTSRVSDIEVDLVSVTHTDQVRQRIQDAVAGLVGDVRVTLIGAMGADVDLRVKELQSLRPSGVDALVIRLGEISVALSEDFDELAKQATITGQFVRDVLSDSDLTEDQRRRVLVTGLRALNPRAVDLEVH